MKRIAIFCDGTWNLSDDKNRQTNVVHLAQAVELTAANGVAQVPIYVRGVGTGLGSNPVSRTTDKIMSGAFGWGLERNIEDAYRRLIWLYEPGDEIYIFGFSRGAYTARSLAGLIRKSGILPRDKVDQVKTAMQLYRKRGKDGHPDAEKIQAERAELSPDVATSLTDLARREKGRPTELLKITYLGVWDTVGALGLPGFLGLFAKVVNSKYAFHDTDLSSSVSSAWHAVSLDERRKTFPPALCGNLGDLNLRSGKDEPPYRQIWFAGDHGSVGGGGDVRGLSAFTHLWITEGAERQGLEMNQEKLEVIRATCNAADPIHNRKQGMMAKALGVLSEDRAGPEAPEDVHTSVVDKIRLGVRNSEGKYRPGSLARVWETLPGLLPKDAPGATPDAFDDDEDEVTPAAT